MNKALIGSILACGLLLLDSPEAAADDERRKQYRPPVHDAVRDYRHNYRYNYARDTRSHDEGHHRAKKMPHWLKHDRSFRRWLGHTRFDRNRYVTWHQLFEVYSREHFYPRYRRH